MHIARLMIKGFRGANNADINLGCHTVLISTVTPPVSTIYRICWTVKLLLGKVPADIDGCAPPQPTTSAPAPVAQGHRGL